MIYKDLISLFRQAIDNLEGQAFFGTGAPEQLNEEQKQYPLCWLFPPTIANSFENDDVYREAWNIRLRFVTSTNSHGESLDEDNFTITKILADAILSQFRDTSELSIESYNLSQIYRTADDIHIGWEATFLLVAFVEPDECCKLYTPLIIPADPDSDQPRFRITNPVTGDVFILAASGFWENETPPWALQTALDSAVASLTAAIATKQDAITTGTTAQYFRGDLSLATFPTNVSSFNNDEGYLDEAAADLLYYKKTDQFIVSSGSSVIAYMRGSSATAFMQYQNSSSGTGTTDGLTVGINGTGGVVLNREVGALFLGVANDFKIHLDSNGNIIVADSAENITPGARFRIRGKNNSVALLVEDDAARALIRAEEVSGSLQLGFFNVSTVTRRLVPTGSSTDSVITALQELGLFRQS